MTFFHVNQTATKLMLIENLKCKYFMEKNSNLKIMASLKLTSHQKFFELVNFWKKYADFSKKRFLDITWVKIVLQSSTKNQNHCNALPDHFKLFSTLVLC